MARMNEAQTGQTRILTCFGRGQLGRNSAASPWWQSGPRLDYELTRER